MGEGLSLCVVTYTHEATNGPYPKNRRKSKTCPYLVLGQVTNS